MEPSTTNVCTSRSTQKVSVDSQFSKLKKECSLFANGEVWDKCVSKSEILLRTSVEAWWWQRHVSNLLEVNSLMRHVTTTCITQTLHSISTASNLCFALRLHTIRMSTRLIRKTIWNMPWKGCVVHRHNLQKHRSCKVIATCYLKDLVCCFRRAVCGV